MVIKSLRWDPTLTPFAKQGIDNLEPSADEGQVMEPLYLPPLFILLIYFSGDSFIFRDYYIKDNIKS